ncbi:hypothetical protein H0H87_002376 [Tephrocybe sp. NHM501043]|nr:hypothetical protein H0H87_002376 [Tephrocybe sp. NHM501043]
MLDGLTIVEPNYIKAFQDLAARKAVINALPPIGTDKAFDVVRNSLSGVKTISDGFKTAMADIMAGAEQDEWNKLADLVISVEVGTISALV